MACNESHSASLRYPAFSICESTVFRLFSAFSLNRRGLYSEGFLHIPTSMALSSVSSSHGSLPKYVFDAVLIPMAL